MAYVDFTLDSLPDVDAVFLGDDCISGTGYEI
jgi:hypothetical protein